MGRSAPAPRAGRWVLLAILVLAAGLRLAAWHGAQFMCNDGPDFLWQAARLRAGDPWDALSHPYHPLYAVAIAAVSFVTGNAVSAAIAVSVASGLLIVLAVAALARRAFPEQPAAAPAAALLAAVHSRSIIETSDVQCDGLFLALTLFSALLLLVAFQRGACRRRMLAAGVLAGLAYLTRPEALYLLAAAALWLVAGLARRGAQPSRTAHVTAALLFVAGLSVVAAPYVLAMHKLTGQWGLSLKPSVAAAGLTSVVATLPPPIDSPLGSPTVHRVSPERQLAPVEPVEPAAPTTPAAIDAATPAPAVSAAPTTSGTTAATAQSAAGVARETSEASEPVGERSARLPPLLDSLVVLGTTLRSDALPLAIVGLAGLWLVRRGLCIVLLLLVAGWVVVGALNLSVNHYLSARHTLVPVLLLLPVGGAGIVMVWRAASGRRALSWLLRTVVVLILLAHAASGIRPRHVGNEPRLAALAFAVEHSAPGQRLGVHRSRDSFYAGRPVLQVELPCYDQALLDAMRQWDVPLLVLDESRVRPNEPEWLDRGPFMTQARFGEGPDAVLVLAPAAPPR